MAGQQQSGGQPQAQNQQQAEQAIAQAFQAHPQAALFSGINWTALIPILIQLIQALKGGSGGTATP